MTTGVEPNDKNKSALEELGFTWRFQHSSLVRSKRLLVVRCESEYACFSCDGKNYQEKLSNYLMGWSGAMQQVKRKLREEQEAQVVGANCADKLSSDEVSMMNSTPKVFMANADKRVANAHEAEKLRNTLFSATLHISNTDSEMFAVVVGDTMLSFDGECLYLTEVCSSSKADGIVVNITESTVIVDSGCGGIVPTEILRSWLQKGGPGKKFARLFPHCMP